MGSVCARAKREVRRLPQWSVLVDVQKIQSSIVSCRDALTAQENERTIVYNQDTWQLDLLQLLYGDIKRQIFTLRIKIFLQVIFHIYLRQSPIMSTYQQAISELVIIYFIRQDISELIIIQFIICCR